jgi:hypothetical protein
MLHLAAKAVQPGAVAFLLERGAKVDAQTEMKQGPPDVSMGTPVAEVLKKHGAKKDAELALHSAVMAGRSDPCLRLQTIVNLLFDSTLRYRKLHLAGLCCGIQNSSTGADLLSPPVCFWASNPNWNIRTFGKCLRRTRYC